MSKILIVEDESSFSEALAFLLGKEGFETVVAEDGRQALDIFAKEGADLILLDLMIPEVSGVEVCRTIRTTSNVPIIMLTAKDAEIDKVVGLELGADDYLAKPFNPRELLARTDIAVSDVAAALGYATPSAFVRAFRRWTGSSPSAWRKAHRTEGV